MPVHRHAQETPSVRQTLVEAEGSPFAPPPVTKPLVDLLDGRTTNADLDPDDWLRGLAAVDGQVAVYFGLAADHEWWLAYDAGFEPRGSTDEMGIPQGPFHRWTTYPSGPWDHQGLPKGLLLTNLRDIYWEGDPEERCDIHRSRIVRIEEAPDMVRQEVQHGDR